MIASLKTVSLMKRLIVHIFVCFKLVVMMSLIAVFKSCRLRLNVNNCDFMKFCHYFAKVIKVIINY